MCVNFVNFGFGVYHPIRLRANIYLLVVASFTEIKTGYRGFETNKIRYFVCLLLAVIISRRAYMNQNLQLEMPFTRY